MPEAMSSRRNLIKGTIASSLLLPFASSRAKEFNPKERWDMESDVVVIGYGGSGATAAIAAHDAGAKVLVLEKLPQGGGNCAASGGGFIIPEDAKKAYEYLKHTYEFAKNDWDPKLLEVFCEGAVSIEAFLKSANPKVRLGKYGHGTFQFLPYAESITKYSVRGRKSGGACLFDTLKTGVEARKIDVRLNAPAKRLIRCGDEVIGLEAEINGKLTRIKAKKGVILATGGFECDKESLQNFTMGSDIHTIGAPGNTGDGLRMAQSMGAKLWHMTSCACPLGIRIPGHPTCYGLGIKGKSFIWVNKLGKRFVNEAGVDVHNCLYNVARLDTLNRQYTAIPCYIVFDEEFRKSGPLTNFTFGYICDTENFHWSRDNLKEIKMGVIKKADTLEELAKLINVPAENLKASVAKWNADITKGDDPEFGRKKQGASKGNANAQFAPSLSAPLAQNGPYYAAELVPTLFHTNGGPRRDVNANIIDVENKPIARLFGCGELGSIWGTFQQGSTNLAECLVFGQIAGRNAAKLKAWN